MTKKLLRGPAITTAVTFALIALAAATRPVGAAGPVTITTAYTTGYTWFDNSPPGPDICCGVIHKSAGGTGTYADPITLAAGLVSSGVLDYPSGTRFYMPDVRRYFIVEDSCGNLGSGGCHFLDNAPSGATIWVDRWVGGTANDSQADVQACANFLTDDGGSTPLHTIVENPPDGLAVVPGPLFQNGQCAAVYGNGPPPAAGPPSTPTPAAPPAATPAPTSTPVAPVVSAPPSTEPSPSPSNLPATPQARPTPAQARAHQSAVAVLVLPALASLVLLFLVGLGAWAWHRRRKSPGP